MRISQNLAKQTKKGKKAKPKCKKRLKNAKMAKKVPKKRKRANAKKCGEKRREYCHEKPTPSAKTGEQSARRAERPQRANTCEIRHRATKKRPKRR